MAVDNRYTHAGLTMKKEREPCSVSHLPPPVRKPPARVLRDWEDPPPFALIEWHATYLVLRLVTPKNAHLLHQEPLETENENGQTTGE
jgi:hypothetical protein